MISTQAASTLPPSFVLPMGRDGNDENVRELKDRARAQVQEAISQLSLEQKEAYLEATKRASKQVLETEADPLQFLRRCNYNVTAAAQRLCLYWRERRSLFGSERAFLPLNLSEQGALTRDDILSLKAGWPVQLPDTARGQKVVLADRRQFHPSCTMENRLRCVFYLANQIAQDEGAQKDGILIVTHGALPRSAKCDMHHTARCHVLLRDVFPVKVHFHLFNLVTPPSKRYETQDFLAEVVDCHVRTGSKLDDLTIHFEREPGHCYQTLLNLGLKREGIPAHFGGTWTFVQTTDWCRATAKADRHLTRKNAAAAAVQALVVKNSHRSAKEKEEEKAAAPPLFQSAQEREERQRELQRQRNLIHSRRKRERRRKELQDLQEEHVQLGGERDYLMAEHERLAHLLVEAQALVAAGNKRQKTDQTAMPKDESC